MANILVIDVQGFELEVLKGCVEETFETRSITSPATSAVWYSTNIQSWFKILMVKHNVDKDARQNQGRLSFLNNVQGINETFQKYQEERKFAKYV